jgi:hypothetical protein
MPSEPRSPDPGALDPPADERPAVSSGRAWRNPAVVTAAVTAAGVVIAAAVTGIFGLLDSTSNSATKSTQTCNGFRADVEIPSRVGPYPTLTINFDCGPVPGRQYLWVVEADGIGKDNHAEYYPKRFQPGVQVGVPFSTSLNLHNDKIGEQNCIYVISVTTQQYENIESNLNGNNFTLQLPDSVDRVSAPACEKREQ